MRRSAQRISHAVRRISHPKDISQIPRRIYFVEKSIAEAMLFSGGPEEIRFSSAGSVSGGSDAPPDGVAKQPLLRLEFFDFKVEDFILSSCARMQERRLRNTNVFGMSVPQQTGAD